MRGMTLLALVTLTSSLAAQERDFMWRGQIAPGDAIEIRGVNGDVTVLRASGREVAVTATKRADRSDPEDVHIEVVTHGDGVTICALYPQRRGGYSECEQGGPEENSTRRNDVAVHWTVRVPAGVAVRGYTVNGDVDARGLESNAFLGTVNGDVGTVMWTLRRVATRRPAPSMGRSMSRWVGRTGPGRCISPL